MFTGIVSDVGEIIEMTPLGERNWLVIASTHNPASIVSGPAPRNLTGVLCDASLVIFVVNKIKTPRAQSKARSARAF